jgi:V/A-type H+-transporting ATPase subunit K
MNPWLLTIILATPIGIAIPLARVRTPRSLFRYVTVTMAITFALALAVLAADFGGDPTGPTADAATMSTATPALVAQATTPATTNDSGSAFIGAAIAVAASALGAGIAIAYAGSAALATISEQPDLFGRAMVVVGLAEGVAIYGLIVAVLILGKV